MCDLAVELAGLPLKNPVICGSGELTSTAEHLRAAVDAGAAAVVAKSTNESQAARAQLAAAEYVTLGPDWAPAAGPGPGTSLMNRSGLVAAPFSEWLRTLASADAYAAERDAYVIASLIVADLGRAAEMASAIQAAGLRCLELNLGAPHGDEAEPGAIETVRAAARAAEVVARVRGAVSIPLLVKLTADGVDPLPVACAARDAGADALVIGGRPLGFLPDPATRRPVLGTFAAVGGGWALPLSLRWVAKARERLGPDVDLVATNGVRSGADVMRCVLAGATAAEAYTVVHLDGPAALGRLVAELAAVARDTGAARIAEVVGEAADHTLTYAQAAAMKGGR
ncbi:MAG: dihydroorotate dehydrogenase [Gaiellales bacterium]